VPVTQIRKEHSILDGWYRNFKFIGNVILTDVSANVNMDFPSKLHNWFKELDKEGIRYLYKRRCKENCLVVPEILPFWGASMNIQRVPKHGFEMYLSKYISKPERSFQVNLSESASDPEKYLHTRVIGPCEALDVQLGFNQYHTSRMVEFLPTELEAKQKFLKSKIKLASLPADSEDVYQKSKFQTYLERNRKLSNIAYPMWWCKANAGEQCKGENNLKKGVIPTVGYKGTDEFEELKLSIQNRKDPINELNTKLDVLIDNLVDGEPNVVTAVIMALENVLSNDILQACKIHFEKNGYRGILCNDITDDDIDKATALLNNAELAEDELVAKFHGKLHWLNEKLLMSDELTETPLYKMLQAYPPGSMLIDTVGSFWIQRAHACVTRHRF